MMTSKTPVSCTNFSSTSSETITIWNYSGGDHMSTASSVNTDQQYTLVGTSSDTLSSISGLDKSWSGFTGAVQNRCLPQPINNSSQLYRLFGADRGKVQSSSTQTSPRLLSSAETNTESSSGASKETLDELLKFIDKLTKQNKQLESSKEDEISRLQNKIKKLINEHDKELEINKNQLEQTILDKDNEFSRLQNEIKKLEDESQKLYKENAEMKEQISNTITLAADQNKAQKLNVEVLKARYELLAGKLRQEVINVKREFGEYAFTTYIQECVNKIGRLNGIISLLSENSVPKRSATMEAISKWEALLQTLSQMKKVFMDALYTQQQSSGDIPNIPLPELPHRPPCPLDKLIDRLLEVDHEQYNASGALELRGARALRETPVDASPMNANVSPTNNLANYHPSSEVQQRNDSTINTSEAKTNLEYNVTISGAMGTTEARNTKINTPDVVRSHASEKGSLITEKINLIESLLRDTNSGKQGNSCLKQKDMDMNIYNNDVKILNTVCQDENLSQSTTTQLASESTLVYDRKIADNSKFSDRVSYIIDSTNDVSKTEQYKEINDSGHTTSKSTKPNENKNTAKLNVADRIVRDAKAHSRNVQAATCGHGSSYSNSEDISSTDPVNASNKITIWHNQRKSLATDSQDSGKKLPSHVKGVGKSDAKSSGECKMKRFTGFQRLIKEISKKLPNTSEEDLDSYLRIARSGNNNTLSGLTLDVIIELVQNVISQEKT